MQKKKKNQQPKREMDDDARMRELLSQIAEDTSLMISCKETYGESTKTHILLLGRADN